MDSTSYLPCHARLAVSLYQIPSAPGDFHPIIAYLFTEWKCNLDCHYCWAFDNRVKGMTEDTAETHCFSTLNHNLAYCYDAGRAIRWVLKQARRGFQGVSGSFD